LVAVEAQPKAEAVPGAALSDWVEAPPIRLAAEAVQVVTHRVELPPFRSTEVLRVVAAGARKGTQQTQQARPSAKGLLSARSSPLAAVEVRRVVLPVLRAAAAAVRAGAEVTVRQAQPGRRRKAPVEELAEPMLRVTQQAVVAVAAQPEDSETVAVAGVLGHVRG